MKKLSRIAALLAATAMLFGAVSCSEPEEEPISNNTPTFKSETVEVDFKLSEGVSIVSITDGKVADETIVTATVADTKVTLKSVKAGKTTVTAKVTVKTGDGEQAGTGTITVTVADTGKINYDPTWKADSTAPENPDVPADPVTYTWSFADLDLSTASFVAASGGNNVWGTSGVAKVTFAEGTSADYDSTPAGLTMNLSNGANGGSYNKINPAQSGKEPGSAGAIEPSKNDMVCVKVTGPFKAKMIYGGNSSSDKTDRTAQLCIDGEVVASGTENLVPATPTTLEYSYTGTDEVTVSFGGTNIVRIYDVIIEK